LKPCTIDREASPTFQALVQHWKKKGFPRIEEDLQKAFQSIAPNFRTANNCRSKPGFGDSLFKYRQKSSDLNRGSSYGFRIYAYYEKDRHTLYPLIIYQKTAMQEYDEKELKEAVKEIIQIASQKNLDLLPPSP
jgi:hypothetical protein